MGFVTAVLGGNDDEAERLCQALSSENAPDLINLAQTALIDPIRATLTSEQELDLQWWSIRGLAICGGQPAMVSLIANLSDSNPEIRGVAALALGHIGQRITDAGQLLVLDDGKSLPHAIATLLDDPDGAVRQAAADALILLEACSVPVLREVLENRTEVARVRAAYALRKIGTRGQSPMDAAPALFQILNDSNYLVHTYAHEALDEMGLLDNVIVTL